MYIEKIISNKTHYYKKVDFYVPVTIEFPDNNDRYGLADVLYYRYLDQDSSLLEVTINSKSTQIVRVALVSINKTVEQANADNTHSKVEVIEGNPLINMGVFSESNIVTENREIKFKYLNKKIWIILSETVDYGVVMGDLTILLNNNNEISGFTVEGFSTKEWEIIQAGCCMET